MEVTPVTSEHVGRLVRLKPEREGPHQGKHFLFTRVFCTHFAELVWQNNSGQPKAIDARLDELILVESKFDMFKRLATKDRQAYVKALEENGSFNYCQVVESLISFSNRANHRLFTYLFGAALGQHYAEGFVEGGRDLLSFLGKLDSDARFFILYELKTNPNLFAYC